MFSNINPVCRASSDPPAVGHRYQWLGDGVSSLCRSKFAGTRSSLLNTIQAMAYVSGFHHNGEFRLFKERVKTLSLLSSESTFSQPSKEKRISEAVRIGCILIISNLSKLRKAKRHFPSVQLIYEDSPFRR